MALTLSLSNALSGLNAASRALEVISSNVANATTEGYARRELQTSARSIGQVGAGVQIDGVIRHVDQRAIADRRGADANLADASTRSDTLKRVEQIVGVPTEAGSLTELIGQFETTLIEANSRPDSNARLTSVVTAAGELTRHLNTISDEIQSQRMQADADLATQIDLLNTSLEQVEDLNVQIFQMQNSGRDTSGLQDQRQLVIDTIAELVPVQEVARDGGKVALFTTSGAVLLEDTAAEIGFTPTGFIAPDMSLTAGSLSGVTINTVPISTTGSFVPLGGGSIGALFDVRDQLMPEAQEAIDAVSRDLVDRFEDLTVDTTRTATDPGFFTDAGAVLDPLDEIGLAGRISVNALADPSQGGDAWRVRDGMMAAAPGAPGDSSLINRMIEATTASRAPASGPYAGISRSLAGHAADFLSGISTQVLSLERTTTFEMARRDTLKGQELLGGVDTDQEMQKLLLVENAYAANARVIQTIDEVLDTMLRIGS